MNESDPSFFPPSPTADPPGAGAASGAEPKVIMIVEDDSDIRASLAELLYDAGYEVATAAHGRDAMYDLESPPRPDLILLDMMMPVLDGWGFMAEFSRKPELSSIPVVVLSAGSGIMSRGLPAAAGYLRKPLDRGTLLQTIQACLGESRSSDPAPST